MYESGNTSLLFRDLYYIGWQIESSDWSTIVELGLWTLQKGNSLAYTDLLKLFERLFETENLQLDSESVKNIFDTICELLFGSENSLLSRELEQNYIGLALTYLIKYSSLQYHNNKNVSYVTRILSNLLTWSNYEGTWAVFGRYLSTIYVMFECWIRDNIDNIFPEEDEGKFCSAWTKIIYEVTNRKCECPLELFRLLKPKFDYALKSRLCIKNDEYECASSLFVITNLVCKLYQKGE
jgi:hypothetical protein